MEFTTNTGFDGAARGPHPPRSAVSPKAPLLFPAPDASEPRHVVVTGVGIVTALGFGWKQNADGFRSGRTAFRDVTLFDVSRQRAKLGAEVSLPQSLPKTLLSAKHERRMERAGKMLLLAAHEAWLQSGWTPAADVPIVLGTTSGGMTLGQDYYRQAIESPNSSRGQTVRMTWYQAQQQALDLCAALGLSGPVTLIANACASGSNAVGHAFDLVRTGQADRALCGGYDALSHLVFSGFDALQALSTTQCRPFDQHRDGLALGEGAGVLTLETYESATARRAEILAEVVGYGASTDVHHLTQPHPNGDAALASMRAATESAGLRPEQIGYINAHGTGTPLNDVSEAAAINRWAGDYAPKLPVSSTKSSVGHCLGAAGAIEGIVCLMALREQWLPPTSTLKTPDPACRFPIVSRPADARFDYALSNSFGFGGANATLIFRRWS